jgi:hypothetical protein
MRSHGGHNFVIQIFDEFGRFLLYSFGRITNSLVHASGCVLHFAIEIFHGRFLPSRCEFGCLQVSSLFPAGRGRVNEVSSLGVHRSSGKSS